MSMDLVETRKLWNKALENYEAMKGTFAELASHPEVNDAQILEAARSLGAVRNSLKEIQRKVRDTPPSNASMRSLQGHYTINRILESKL